MKTIFVSSTFKDMHFERDAIQEIALPTLKSEAIKYGESVSFCDLRWGINTGNLDSEEGSRKVLDVCLDEIDRCKPPMVIILGDRYGWIPDEDLMRNAAERKHMDKETLKAAMQLEDLQISVTALEIAYGALSTPEKRNSALFYFRHIETDCPEDYLPEDTEHKKKLDLLKAKIEELTGGRIKHYTVRWDGEKLDGVIQFAEMLAEDIKAELLPEWQKKELLTPFERERLTHWSFIEEKNSMFSARSAMVQRFFNDLTQNGKNFLAVKAPSGSGKSMLFSNLALKFRDNGYDTMPFISGLTSESNDSVDILRNTIYYLEELLGFEHETFGAEYHTHEDSTESGGEQKKKTSGIDKLRERLLSLCLECEQAKKKVVIMVDAVDQLNSDDNRDNLIFIPERLSGNVKFVMTCLPELELGRRDSITVKPINDTEKREVIDGILKSHSRELEEVVIRKMIKAKSSSNPLFLSLLVQRLLMMNRDDFLAIKKAGDGMKAISKHQLEVIATCPDSLQKMSAALLAEAGKRINEDLVLKVAEYLAVSRHGLRQEDLAALLADQWSALDFAHFITYMDENFIQRDDGRFDFSHKCIREGFLELCRNTDEIHTQILNYFDTLPIDDRVRMQESVYHMIAIDDKSRFASYIGIIKEFVVANEMAAKDLFSYSMSDGGKWFCDVLDYAETLGADTDMCNFVNRYFDRNISGTLDEMKMRIAVLDSNVQLAERLFVTDTSEKIIIANTYIHYTTSRKDIDLRSYHAFSQFKWDKSVYYVKAFDIYNAMPELINDPDHVYKITSICTHFSGYKKQVMAGIKIANRFLRENQNISIEINLAKLYLSLASVYYVKGARKVAFLSDAIKTVEQIEPFISTLSKSDKDQLADVYFSLSKDYPFDKQRLVYIQKYFDLKMEILENPNSLNGKMALAAANKDFASQLRLLGEWNKAIEAHKAAIELYQQIYRQYGLKTAVASAVDNMSGLGFCYMQQYDAEKEMATYKQAANYLFESLKDDADILYVFPEITWVDGNSADLKMWIKVLGYIAKFSYQFFVKKEKPVMPQYPLDPLYHSIFERQGEFDCFKDFEILRYKISKRNIKSKKRYINHLKRTNQSIVLRGSIDSLSVQYEQTSNILRSIDKNKYRMLSVLYAHKAVSLLKKSKRISRKEDPKDQAQFHVHLPFAYGEIGYCYEILGLKSIALYFYKKAISIYEHKDYKKYNNINTPCNNYVIARLANIYYQKGKATQGNKWVELIFERENREVGIPKQPRLERWHGDYFKHSNVQYIYSYIEEPKFKNRTDFKISSIHHDPSGYLRRKDALKQIVDKNPSFKNMILLRMTQGMSCLPGAYKNGTSEFIEQHLLNIAIDKQISEKFPQTDCRSMLAWDYGNLVLLHYLSGDFDKALEYSVEAEKLFKEMASQDDSPKIIYDLSTLYRNIGEIHSASGGKENSALALKYFLMNVELDEKCYEESESANFSFTMMLSYRRLAIMYESLNKIDDAKLYHGKAFKCLISPNIATEGYDSHMAQMYLVSNLLEIVEKDYLTAAEKFNCYQKAIEVLKIIAATRGELLDYWCPLIIKDIEKRIKKLQ